MVFYSGRRLRTLVRKIGGKNQGGIASEQPDPHALLASANSASERLAGQHITFMAVCVYVLVIVFGTTDLDLLVGKGVKLPVVNVDVPIVGFYAFAPYLVVLAHFNLLLQLQLLSRKLFAFDAVVPKEENIGGLRGRLHIFPYTFYLVGRPPVLVRRLLGLMVSITLLLLPLVTLIALQLWFLAYQSETVTWWQRIAIWCDILMVTILWPIILNSKDDWQGYWREILTAHIPRRRVWGAFVLLLLGQILFSFSATHQDISHLFEQPFFQQGETSLQDGKTLLFSEIGPFMVGYVFLLLSPPVLVLLCGWNSVPAKRKTCFTVLFLLVIGILATSITFKKDELFMVAIFAVPWLFIPLAMFWHPESPRGSLALLLMIYIGPLLPLTLHIDGERIERILLYVQGRPDGSIVLSRFLEERRRLDLTEQVLLAKPASPETLSLVRLGEEEKALRQTEPININDRNLRHAQMYEAVLIGASLRGVDITGAYLDRAHLHGASFYGASLQDAVFKNTRLQLVCLGEADLQSAYLGGAFLQGADLRGANLRGADLRGAHLQKANLSNADLQGAILSEADLQGAILIGAELQGADLSEADLQGADLSGACLEGAVLNKAKLYGATIDREVATLVDARGVVLNPGDLEKDVTVEKKDIHLHSCLAMSKDLAMCDNHYDFERKGDFDRFRTQLHSFLGELVCESPHIAWGIIQQIPKEQDNSSRQGLGDVLKGHLDDNECKGLQELRSDKREFLENYLSPKNHPAVIQP